MHEALSRLAKLPSNTLVYSGHEYTVNNLQFAKAVEPNNKDIDELLIWAKNQVIPGDLKKIMIHLLSHLPLRYLHPDTPWTEREGSSGRPHHDGTRAEGQSFHALGGKGCPEGLW